MLGKDPMINLKFKFIVEINISKVLSISNSYTSSSNISFSFVLPERDLGRLVACVWWPKGWFRSCRYETKQINRDALTRRWWARPFDWLLGELRSELYGRGNSGGSEFRSTLPCVALGYMIDSDSGKRRTWGPFRGWTGSFTPGWLRARTRGYIYEIHSLDVNQVRLEASFVTIPRSQLFAPDRSNSPRGRELDDHGARSMELFL